MKTIARTAIAVSIGLAGSTALAETSAFPSSADEVSALSVETSDADRYSAGRASEHRSIKLAPERASWRVRPEGSTAAPQAADG